jgi:hypothetical protein
MVQITTNTLFQVGELHRVEAFQATFALKSSRCADPDEPVKTSTVTKSRSGANVSSLSNLAEPRQNHRVLKLACPWIASARERHGALTFEPKGASPAFGHDWTRDLTSVTGLRPPSTSDQLR